jgi:hypothetical protein
VSSLRRVMWLVLFASGFSAANVSAQSKVLKQRLADGTVLYSDHAVKGARVEGVIESPRARPVLGPPLDGAAQPNVMPLPSGPVPTLPPLPQMSLPGASALRSAAITPNVERDRAHKELTEALAAQSSGSIPQAGDRLHTASGMQRFSESYVKRQEALAKRVESAQAAMKAQGL